MHISWSREIRWRSDNVGFHCDLSAARFLRIKFALQRLILFNSIEVNTLILKKQAGHAFHICNLVMNANMNAGRPTMG